VENEKLKHTQMNLENRVLATEAEISALRSTNVQLEATLEEVRSSLVMSRRETHELNDKLEERNKELIRMQHENLAENEKAEHALLEASKNNTKYIHVHEEKVQIENNMRNVERRLQNLEDENEVLLSKLNKSDQLNSQLSLQVDEKLREIGSLSRQLDTAIQDSKRSTDAQHARLANKERSSQARIMELEAQLARNKAELSQVRRAKEEADRKFNVRLQDLRDRLEQSHVTNRSMQNYIGFLKTS